MKSRVVSLIILVLLTLMVARITFFEGFKYSLPLEGLKKPVSIPVYSFTYLQIALAIISIATNILLIKLVLSARIKKVKGDNYFLLLILVIILLFLASVLSGIHYYETRALTKGVSKENELSGAKSQKQSSWSSQGASSSSTESSSETEVDYQVETATKNPPLFLALLANNLILVSLLSLLILLSIMAYKMVFAEKEKEEVILHKTTTKQKAEEALAIVNKSIDYVLKEHDYRKAVVYYYLEMCKLVKKYGARIKESWTAREVEKAVLEAFPGIPRGPLEKLTDLFEYARYSHYPVLEHHRDEALKCLQSIREYLRAVANEASELRGA